MLAAPSLPLWLPPWLFAKSRRRYSTGVKKKIRRAPGHTGTMMTSTDDTECCCNCVGCLLASTSLDVDISWFRDGSATLPPLSSCLGGGRVIHEVCTGTALNTSMSMPKVFEAIGFAQYEVVFVEPPTSADHGIIYKTADSWVGGDTRICCAQHSTKGVWRVRATIRCPREDRYLTDSVDIGFTYDTATQVNGDSGPAHSGICLPDYESCCGLSLFSAGGRSATGLWPNFCAGELITLSGTGTSNEGIACFGNDWNLGGTITAQLNF